MTRYELGGIFVANLEPRLKFTEHALQAGSLEWIMRGWVF